jgi:peptidoglycan LD-endopeptidase CwlK
MSLSATSLERLSLVHPELSRRIHQLDSLIPSVNLQVTQGLRTWAQQDVLFRQIPKVTEVPGGYSAHNFGYAVDVVPEDIMPGQPDWSLSHPAWQKILAAAPSCGLAEGAKWRTFPDAPHLYLQELPAEPTDQMRNDFRGGGIAAVWEDWVGMLVLQAP